MRHDLNQTKQLQAKNHDAGVKPVVTSRRELGKSALALAGLGLIPRLPADAQNKGAVNPKCPPVAEPTNRLVVTVKKQAKKQGKPRHYETELCPSGGVKVTKSKKNKSRKDSIEMILGEKSGPNKIWVQPLSLKKGKETIHHDLHEFFVFEKHGKRLPGSPRLRGPEQRFRINKKKATVLYFREKIGVKPNPAGRTPFSLNKIGKFDTTYGKQLSFEYLRKGRLLEFVDDPDHRDYHMEC